MINEFFDYDKIKDGGWDCIHYYACVLKKSFGNYKVGDNISVIEVDYKNGKIQFCNDNGDTIATFKMGLHIS